VATNIRIKKGATLGYTGQIKKEGVALDLAGHSITSQIRDEQRKLIDYFDITVTDESLGKYSAITHTSTSSYPTSVLYFDVRILRAADSVVVYTETGTVIIEQSITS